MNKTMKGLTRTQKEALSRNKIVSSDWKLVCEVQYYIKISNKHSGKTITFNMTL